jgi:hypothetical protein
MGACCRCPRSAADSFEGSGIRGVGAPDFPLRSCWVGLVALRMSKTISARSLVARRMFGSRRFPTSGGRLVSGSEVTDEYMSGGCRIRAVSTSAALLILKIGHCLHAQLCGSSLAEIDPAMLDAVPHGGRNRAGTEGPSRIPGNGSHNTEDGPNGSPETVIEYPTAVTARGRFQGHDPADVAVGPIPTCQWYLIKL